MSAPTAEDAAVELARVVDRLRTMPLVRLGAPWDSFPSRAVGARGLAQELADRAAALDGIERHAVPDAGEAAVGDQVAVTGRDLLVLHPGPDDLEWMSRRLREFRLSV